MLVQPLSILLPSQSALSDIDLHVLDAKGTFSEMRHQQLYQSLKDSMLVYRISNYRQTYTGIVLGVNISEFNGKAIIPHELTIPKKVERQAQVAVEQGGFSKPILLTHRPIFEVKAIISRITKSKPLIDVFLEKYQATHQIWPITAFKDIESIRQAYREKKNGYIVDGHHRTAAIHLLNQDDAFKLKAGLCAMFDIEELEILPFHRIVDLDIPVDIFIQKLRNVGQIENLSQARFPKSRNEIVFIVADQVISLKLKSTNLNKHEQLDVNHLSNSVFTDILNIKETENSPIQYLEGKFDISEIQSMIQGTHRMACLLYPISIDDLIAITNEGNLLPPKSTWFLPRMANGVVSMTWVNE